MKFLLLYPYPPEPDGQSLQGYYLMKGLRELGHDIIPCDRDDSLEKSWAYEHFKPDAAIGVGFWGDTPEVVIDPLKHGVTPVPWFNADGWVANYHDTLNKLPLVVATSNWVKSTYMRDGLSGDNIEVLGIGYDPKIFYPRAKDDLGAKKIREMIGVKEDERMILTIGGDVTSKGAQEMFHALVKIDNEFPKWKYVCKGSDNFSTRNHGREERKLLRELGLKRKVAYLEGMFSPEFMSQLINACDIYAAPSRLEGFGMIQLEAQACGKPVVSINVGGPRDTIKHGETGYLADVAYETKLERELVYKSMGFNKKKYIEFPIPKTFAYRANIDQLAGYTLKLLKDDELRAKMGNAAAIHAFNNFNYKVIAQKMVDIIKQKITDKPIIKPEIEAVK